MKKDRQTDAARTSSGRLRIAIAVQALDVPGGKERDALAIAGGLASRGHEVTILSRSIRLQAPPQITIQKIDVNGWSNHGRAMSFARAIAGVAKRHDFDVLLSFEKIKDVDIYYGADVCFVGRRRGLESWMPRYSTYARLEQECLGQGGPDILFLCEKQVKEYKQYYALDDGRITILPPMIHKSGRREFYERRVLMRKKLHIPNTATLAVSVAVYAHQKGFDRTIAALRQIPELYLVAAGLKDIKGSNKMAGKLGVSARTRFIGHTDEIPDILGAGDIMLHPARVENTGLVILESLIAGVPVIANANCGFAECIERFGAGTVLSEPFEDADYVSKIQAALAPERLSELKRLARESAPQLRSEGSLEHILDKIEHVIKLRLTKRNANTIEAA